MKYLLSIVLWATFLCAAQPQQTTKAIDKDIKKTADLIGQKNKEASKLSSSMEESAKDILDEKSNIKSLDEQTNHL